MHGILRKHVSRISRAEILTAKFGSQGIPYSLDGIKNKRSTG